MDKTTIAKKYKNMTTCNKQIGAKLRKYKENEPVNDTEILILLTCHPTKNINIDNIEYLVMRRRHPYNTLSLYYKYKTTNKVDDISWKLCIRNLYGKYKRDSEYTYDVNTAFRNECHYGTKKEFFLKNTKLINNEYIGKCERCNETTIEITTDHYPVPYKKILQDFKMKHSLNLTDLDIYENDQNEIRLKDEQIASTWKTYHDTHSTYRLLCKRCNSTCGSYGY